MCLCVLVFAGPHWDVKRAPLRLISSKEPVQNARCKFKVVGWWGSGAVGWGQTVGPQKRLDELLPGSHPHQRAVLRTYSSLSLPMCVVVCDTCAMDTYVPSKYVVLSLNDIVRRTACTALAKWSVWSLAGVAVCEINSWPERLLRLRLPLELGGTDLGHLLLAVLACFPPTAVID